MASGETYEQAAARELAEELGIVDTEVELVGAGRYEDDAVRLIGRCYRVVHDGPFRFVDGEVAEIRHVTASELHALAAGGGLRAGQLGDGAPAPHRLRVVIPVGPTRRPQVIEPRDHPDSEMRGRPCRCTAPTPSSWPPSAARSPTRSTAINQLMSTVDGVLDGTAWTGPARDRFGQDWNGSFKQALNRLNEAFGAAGHDCVARSDELLG